MSVGPDVPVFDPHLATGAANIGITTLVSEQLFLEDPQTGDTKPNLAESWSVSKDSTLWTIKLRKNVKFQDGTPFDAQAVKYNLERVIDPATRAPGRDRLESVESIQVVDPYTLAIKTKPFVPFIRMLTEPSIGMNSPTQLRKLGKDYPTAPMGTGPFLFVEHRRGEFVRLKANTSYWGGRPLIDELLVRVIPDPAARLIALQSGDIDVAYDLPPKDFRRAVVTSDRLEPIPAVQQREIFIFLNSRWGPFKDVRVREAMNCAVNSDVISRVVFGGAAEPMTAPITKRSFGYSPVVPCNDAGKAKRLLADAGFANGFDVKLNYGVGQYAMDAQVLELVQGMLLNVGVRARIEAAEWGAYFQNVFNHPADFQMTFNGISNGILDAEKGLRHFHSTQFPPHGSNYGLYANPQFDALIDKAVAANDPAERKSLYAQSIKMLWEDAPTIFLYIQPTFHGKSKKVRDIWIRANETIEVRHAWLAP